MLFEAHIPLGFISCWLVVWYIDTEGLSLIHYPEWRSKIPAVARVSRPYCWHALAACVHSCDVSDSLLPAPEM